MGPTFTELHRGGSGTPLLCLHGFTDTWRTWELVLPALELHHDVLALTLPGHAGGARIPAELDGETLVDAVEQAMDEAQMPRAHIVGNSLGGFVALQLACRGRASSVVALAPAGGWEDGDESYRQTLEHFASMRQLLKLVVSQTDLILASTKGRRRATEFIAINFEHIPVELLAHQLHGVVRCDGASALIEQAKQETWSLDAQRIDCPLRIVWGTEDRLLPWPSAAARYRDQLLVDADWVLLDGVGHCPQLDVPARTAELILGFTRP